MHGAFFPSCFGRVKVEIGVALEKMLESLEIRVQFDVLSDVQSGRE